MMSGNARRFKACIPDHNGRSDMNTHCPKCDHEFEVNEDDYNDAIASRDYRIKELEALLLKFSDSPTGDLFATKQKLETANRLCDEQHQHILELELDVAKMSEALDKIVKITPCLDHGSCYYPMHDGDGNPTGEQGVDPVGVITDMCHIASEALENHK